MESVVGQLTALGHPQRLGLFRLLVRRFPDAVAAGELADALGLKPSTLSVYLSALRQAGLIVQERRGTSLRYSADIGGTRDLLGYLAGDCCRGRPDLCQPLVFSTDGPATMTQQTYNVLFICTGNSARSIFGESILRHEAGDRFTAFSAGTSPRSELNDFAVELLRSKGHDVSPLRAKTIAEFQTADAPQMDFVFTVCDRAANEECPPWEGQPITAHWGMPDPVKAQGTEAERRLAFQHAYGALRNRILAFAALPISSLGRLALQRHVDDIARSLEGAMTVYALNGLGRIGKLALRPLLERGAEIAWLNDAVGDPAMHAHLMEFDSVHGRWPAAFSADDEAVTVDGRRLPVHAARRIGDLPTDGVDVVLDCTGVFRTEAQLAPYFDAGVSKVVVSAPVKDGDAANLVWGVNHDSYDPARHRIVTAASCTTNCLAPVVKVLHEGVGIRHGSITTIHDVTNTQTIVDRPAKDLRRARSALNSLIPTTTGSATAIALIYPELKGRLNGHAVRVPLLNASLTDCVFEMQRETGAEEVNGLFRTAATGPLAGILGFEDRPLVSADYVNDTRSAIVDGPSTMVVNGTQVKVYAWYDNEMAYAHRLVDIALMVGAAL